MKVKFDKSKIAAILLTLVLVINIVLFALGAINDIIFWAVIILIALFTYFVFPKLKE